MRGKPSAARRDSSIPRITPAHAGKTLGIGRELYTAPDHPRACGEN